MKRLNAGPKKILCANDASPFNYYAWPSITRLPDGALAIAAAGLRLEHICPFGKGVICYSRDEGETWEYLSTVPPHEELEKGFVEPHVCQLPDGTLIGAVCGIGLNVGGTFPPELRDLAARNGYAEDLAAADEKRIAAEVTVWPGHHRLPSPSLRAEPPEFRFPAVGRPRRNRESNLCRWRRCA